MSSTKFTPGPWKLGVLVDHGARQEIDGQCRWYGLATVCVMMDGEPYEEGQANAHLIAAAPELYEALELWLHYAEMNLSEFDLEPCSAESLCPRCESSGCIYLKISSARSALKKARGE